MSDNISDKLSFHSIEEPDIDIIHKYQNGSQCGWILGSFLDQDEPWMPMTRQLLKEKLAEMQKEKSGGVFAIRTPQEEFIGVASFNTGWDPVCPNFAVIIWPEFRRQGHGSQVAATMLDRIFNQYHGHMTDTWINDWNEGSQAFVLSLGFKPAGVFRRAYVRDGKYSNILIFDILKQEYQTHGQKESQGVRQWTP